MLLIFGIALGAFSFYALAGGWGLVAFVVCCVFLFGVFSL